MNRDYMLLFSQKEIDNLFINVNFSFLSVNNYSERSIIFNYHLWIDLLQDTIEKECYLVKTEQHYLQSEQTVSQSFFESETTLFNEIMIYRNEQII